MKPDFDWLDWVLVHDSNVHFLRGETMRIYDDCETPFGIIAGALGVAFCVAFVGQFIWKESSLLGFCALAIGIWFGILGFRRRAELITRRSEAVLIEGELLTAKSDMAESEGTILTYRFVSPDGQIQSVEGYASVKPERFAAGDKLIILYASDGTHTVL